MLLMLMLLFFFISFSCHISITHAIFAPWRAMPYGDATPCFSMLLAYIAAADICCYFVTATF